MGNCSAKFKKNEGSEKYLLKVEEKMTENKTKEEPKFFQNQDKSINSISNHLKYIFVNDFSTNQQKIKFLTSNFVSSQLKCGENISNIINALKLKKKSDLIIVIIEISKKINGFKNFKEKYLEELKENFTSNFYFLCDENIEEKYLNKFEDFFTVENFESFLDSFLEIFHIIFYFKGDGVVSEMTKFWKKNKKINSNESQENFKEQIKKIEEISHIFLEKFKIINENLENFSENFLKDFYNEILNKSEFEEKYERESISNQNHISVEVEHLGNTVGNYQLDIIENRYNWNQK